MRAISPHSEFAVWLVEPAQKLLTDPRTGSAHYEVVDKGHQAQFSVQGLMDHEVEEALSKFNYSGLPEGVSPLARTSVFDTEAYVQAFPENERDALIVQLDQRLEDYCERKPSIAFVVPQPEAPKPWPSYDTMPVEDILEFQKVLQISPSKIRLYELENKDRIEIVGAMHLREFGEPLPGTEEVTTDVTEAVPSA